MTTIYRALIPPLQLAVWLLACALGVAVVIQHVNAVHRASAARAEVCRVKLEAVMARAPILRKGHFMLDDHCRNLAALTGEVVR